MMGPFYPDVIQENIADIGLRKNVISIIPVTGGN